MNVVIPLSPRRCTLALAVMVLTLLAASTGTTLLSFVATEDPFLSQVRESTIRLLWLDGEGNIPAWYSSSVLLLCSLLLATIALAERQRAGSSVTGWWLLSLIFAFLSMDETAQLHELSIDPLQEALHTTGFLHYAWIVPAALCVAIFVLGYYRFLMLLPRRTRSLFIAAGTIFVGGALGVEAVSGMQASLHGQQNLTYHAIITAEELFEMAGIVVFVYALLDYLGRQFGTVAVQFRPDQK